MKLVMFDMDGTLTDDFAIAENCYVLAIEQALGLPGVKTEWETYPHTTSSYCLQEIVRRARGTPPTPAESRAVQQRMIGIMSEVTRRTGRRTREIPGAAEAVRELRRRGYAVAIASGDWEAIARHKFATAGIPYEDLPAAFCEAAVPRTGIMQAARARAAAHHGVPDFERITYVGDAAWDVRACRELGWPFVGVGAGEFARRMPGLGVTHLVSHYLDFGAFLAAVEAAGPPRAAPVRL
ncbi:MAG: HAD family hydrolase [Opitutae bacterium]|nr:HAD family hydrolase [Opitutae bacterium]